MFSTTKTRPPAPVELQRRTIQIPDAQTVFAFLRRRRTSRIRPPVCPPHVVHSAADITREASTSVLLNSSDVAANYPRQPPACISSPISPPSLPFDVKQPVSTPLSSWDKLTHASGPLATQASSPASSSPASLPSPSSPAHELSQRSAWSDYSFVVASPPPSSFGSLSPSSLITPPTSEEGPLGGLPAVENQCLPSPTSSPLPASSDDGVFSHAAVDYDGGHLPTYRTPSTRIGESFWPEQLESWLYVWDYSWKLSSGEDVTHEEVRHAEDINIEVPRLIVLYTMAASALFDYETAHGRLEDLAELPYYLDEYEGEEVWVVDFSIEVGMPEDKPGSNHSASDGRRGTAWYSIASGSDLSPLFPDEDDAGLPCIHDTAPHLQPWFGTKHTTPAVPSRQFIQRSYSRYATTDSAGECPNEEQADVQEDQGDYTLNNDTRRVPAIHSEREGDQNPWEDKEGLPVMYNQYTREYYTLHGVIGDGGCARVFHATDDHGRAFALKVSHKMHAFRLPMSRKMLRQELQIMGSAASHGSKRLLGVVASWEGTENICFLMHGNLKRTLDLRAHEHVLDDAKIYCAEMVYAVYQLHKAGVVHRDIKPQNFLVDARGHIKLGDFGLAFWAKDKKPSTLFEHVKTRGYVGTLGYMAPETAKHQEYNSKVDIWQLGCVFVELFARLRQPWLYLHPGVFSVPDEEARSILHASVCRLVKSPRDPLDLVLQMTEYDPKDRPNAKDIMEHRYFAGIDWHDIAEDKFKHTFHPPPVVPDSEHTERFETFHRGVGSEYREFARNYNGRLVAPKGIQERVDMWRKHPHVFAWPRRKWFDPKGLFGNGVPICSDIGGTGAYVVIGGSVSRFGPPASSRCRSV